MCIRDSFRALVAVLPSEEFCVDLFLTALVGDSEDVGQILMLWIVRAAELLEVRTPPVRAIVWPVDDIEVGVVMGPTIIIYLDSNTLFCQKPFDFLTYRFSALVLRSCVGHFSTLGNCLDVVLMLLLVPAIASSGLCSLQIQEPL